MTEAERRLWMFLRRKQLGGHRFRRQVPLGHYVADFACLDRRLIVELDGGQHAEMADRDRSRDDWLAARGYRVVRFWNNDVLRDTPSVLEVVQRALEGKE